ncbi:hypothetical protein F2Q70_00030055 [Brassica cretica]|uniref:Uncharacterized protein n=1 Tax=Brassica cretica TaxID=69181 RepID=A0A8S9FGC3_BRACR|nr:hypothetical protein F2Q70_00030055 [Brassica cretica]
MGSSPSSEGVLIGSGGYFEDFQCHRFEVNQYLVAEVMPVLLKSGLSASREETVEKRNLVSDNTVHYGTVHSNIIHHGTVHLNTIHPASIDTVLPPSIDTVHPASIDTVYHASIDTVHPASTNTVHPDTVHPVKNDTNCGETEKNEVLILEVNENGMLKDEEGRTRNSA